MASTDVGQSVTVHCRECRCPGTPGAYHQHDEVYLAPEPSLRMGIAAQFALQSSVVKGNFDESEATIAFMEVFVRHGVTGWNLVDEGGMAIPLDIPAILADFSLSGPAADKASELYMEKVTAPLVQRLSTTLQRGQTARSSSASKRSTRKRPGSSSRSTSAASLPSMP